VSNNATINQANSKHGLSRTTVNRDDEEVGVAHEVKSPENQPKFFQTMGQYWLGPNNLSDRPEMLLPSD